MLRSWSIPLAVFSIVLIAAVPAVRAQDTRTQKDIDELFNRLQKIVDSLEVNYKRIANDVDANKRNIDSLRFEHGDLRINVSGLETRIEKLEAALGQLQNSIHTAKKAPFSDKPNQGAPMPPLSGDLPKNGNGTPTTEIDIKNVLLRLGKLEIQYSDMKRDVEKLRKNVTTNLYYPPKELGLDEIKNRLGKLEKDITGLNSGGKRTSKSSPTTGRLRLVNMSGDLILFVINGRPERVEPGTYKEIELVPAGTIAYEAISQIRGSRGQIVTQLGPNEILTLTAR